MISCMHVGCFYVCMFENCLQCLLFDAQLPARRIPFKERPRAYITFLVSEACHPLALTSGLVTMQIWTLHRQR